MKEIKLTQGKVALVDDEDYEYLNQWKWCAHRSRKTYYATRHIKGDNGKMISIHRVIMDTPIGMEVDHLDGNGLNNQRHNLRNCTFGENRRNRKLNKNNKTGYKGVIYTRHPNDCHVYIQARIKIDNKIVILGHFKTEIAAALAYNKAALQYHGKFARLNVI